MAEVIEVEATPIEEGIEPLAGLRLALSDLATRADQLAAEYAPRFIEGEEEYAQCKRERAGLRKARERIQQDYKAMVDPIRDMLAEADAQRRQALAQVDAKERGYADEIHDYEGRWRDARRAYLAEVYEDFAPDLVPLVSIDALMARYGQTKGAQWDARSTGEAKAADALRTAVESIADAERTIDSMVAEEDREAVKAGYFASLDLQAALNDARARAEQRERVRRLEEERRQREEEARRAQEEAERRRHDELRAQEEAARAAEPEPEPPAIIDTHTNLTPQQYLEEYEAVTGQPAPDKTRQTLLSDMAVLAGAPRGGDRVPEYVFAGYGSRQQAELFITWCAQVGVTRKTKIPTQGKLYKLSAR